MYSVYSAERDCCNSTTRRSGDALFAVHQSVAGFKRRFNLELTNECIWAESPIQGGFSLLTINHQVSSNIGAKTNGQYFHSLKAILNPHSFRVAL